MREQAHRVHVKFPGGEFSMTHMREPGANPRDKPKSNLPEGFNVVLSEVFAMDRGLSVYFPRVYIRLEAVA